MKKDNFYIITGGPGGGKTSMLNGLLIHGFHYVEETARRIIKERLRIGLPPRPEPQVFSNEIFSTDFENFISNSSLESVLFFDRSFLDSSLMVFQSNDENFHHIKEILQTHRYNKKVFITPPWEEIYCQDGERDQSFEQAVMVYDQLYKWYEAHSYDLVIVPKDSIENRAKFIISEI